MIYHLRIQHAGVPVHERHGPGIDGKRGGDIHVGLHVGVGAGGGGEAIIPAGEVVIRVGYGGHRAAVVSLGDGLRRITA